MALLQYIFITKQNNPGDDPSILQATDKAIHRGKKTAFDIGTIERG
jgi:hypothetical protein